MEYGVRHPRYALQTIAPTRREYGVRHPRYALKSVTRPGRSGVGHQWAYLPDVAETIAQLLERAAELEPFARFHMGGHWDPKGERIYEAIDAVVTAAGGVKPRRRGFPWPLVTALSPFVTLFRELREMRYLWRVPLRLDNRRLTAFLGAEPHTPWEDAVRATLVGLDCVPASTGARPASVAPVARSA